MNYPCNDFYQAFGVHFTWRVFLLNRMEAKCMKKALEITGKVLLWVLGILIGGTASPITDFMPLAERLSADYRVVILESFGYQ